MKIDKTGLSEKNLEIIDSMLSKSSHDPPELEDMWLMMDNVWDEIGCDNKNLDSSRIDEFYNHPVWLLNGLFQEQHELSMQHRHVISDWIVKHNLRHILDYGGGFGTLARLIADKDPDASIDIYEPYPSDYAISKTSQYSHINFVSTIESKYDCVVSLDVLEHIPDPLKLLAEMIYHLKTEGYLIIANNFYPVIKCHLPATFHMRYSFKIFAGMMGVEMVGTCEGSHSFIYRKNKEIAPDWYRIRRYERISRLLFPLLQFPHLFLRRFKQLTDWK